MHKLVPLTLLAALGVGAGSADPQQRTSYKDARFPFPLVDEAKQEPEFAAFRAGLLVAVKNRDPKAIAEAMSPALRDRQRGLFVPPFINTIAYETERALALGGSFTTTRGAVFGRREFCAPYVYSAFPNVLPDALEGEVDPWAIIDAHVPVRAQRRPTAGVIAYLSWELVRASGWLDADPESRRRWAEVTLPDGRHGYVPEGKIQPPDDYHVCFAKIDGRWLMTAFERDQSPARGH